MKQILSQFIVASERI